MICLLVLVALVNACNSVPGLPTPPDITRYVGAVDPKTSEAYWRGRRIESDEPSVNYTWQKGFTERFVCVTPDDYEHGENYTMDVIAAYKKALVELEQCRRR